MGDRTSVTLFFLASQKEKVDEILEGIDQEPNWEDLANEDGQKLLAYHYDEVNYGELDFLPLLSDAGIAYESLWNKGSEFDEGGEYCRFTKDGERVVTTLYAGDRSISTELLMNLIDAPGALVTFIKGRHERSTVLPWTDQEKHGPTFRAMNLISK